MRKELLLAASLGVLLPPSEALAAPEVPSITQSEDEPSLAEFQAIVAEMRAALFRPGERVEGWDHGGADLDAAIRRLGAERHYYVTGGSDLGTSVGILTDRPIRDFVPAGWRIVDSFGSEAGDLDNPEVGFEQISPRYVVATRGDSRRVNDVSCVDTVSHALLFEVPGAPPREDDDVVPMLFRLGLLAMEGQTICTRTDGDAERGYRFRYFLPDGRLLPELTDPQEITRIVPAAPIDTLLVPPPPQPREGDPDRTT